METLKDMWDEACLSTGIPAISIDTSARILAVVYVHGNNEAFVCNKTFLADVRYIQKRFGNYPVPVILTILILSTLVSFVQIGKARAERDNVCRELYLANKKIDSLEVGG